MPFNSITFIFFISLFTIVYYGIGKIKYKIVLLLIGSWIFYAYGTVINLIHLLVITTITLLFANKISKDRKNNWMLPIAISIILLQLIIVKYSSNLLLQIFDIKTAIINLMPIGISFYSLQAIALLVDIKNNKVHYEFDYSKLALFLSFFPQSIAGPIHRANELLPQFRAKREFNPNNIIIGFKTMLWGYVCKLIMADKIALIIDPIFIAYGEYNGLIIFIGVLLYSFQIYFDFWGYSLIAIGAGRILGFNINVNFLSPYSAKSFKDFWHRWHVTLSKWMRDYIYIPLGGRKNNSYFYFCSAVMITFIISGFWHGITINFILWGVIHGILYLTEDLIIKKLAYVPHFKNKIASSYFIGFLWPIMFFILISFTWLVFRTNHPSVVKNILSIIFNFSEWSLLGAKGFYFTTINIYYFLLIGTILFLSYTVMIKKILMQIPSTLIESVKDSVFICTSLICIIIWGDIGSQEFLYFKF